MEYASRLEAASKLCELSLKYKKEKKTLVCALPRGGVVIGALLAKTLSLPLELICAKKISAPGAEEFAIGAVTCFGEPLWYPQAESFSNEEKHLSLEKARREAMDRFVLYYHERTWPEFKGKTVLLVDDGIATGATIECSIAYLRKQAVQKIVVIAPVAPQDTYQRLEKLADELIIPHVPTEFFAVGQFYKEFPEVTDQEVLSTLRELIYM